MTESQEQICLFDWAAYQTVKYPELAYLYHIPNGGLRNKATAARLKREGVKPGVPDLCLPVARGGYHGLYIEMKARKGRMSENQRMRQQILTIQGYSCVTCWGFEAAREQIIKYLESGEEIW